MTELLTAEAKRHIEKMRRALAPAADKLDRQFRAFLRKQGYDPAGADAIAAISPPAICRSTSLRRFLEEMDLTGRQLANLNVPPGDINHALARCDQFLDSVLAGRFQPGREQILLAIQITLREAFYRVREAECQTFFGLYEAELGAAGREDLLNRFLRVLVKAFGARTGRLLLSDGPFGSDLARPHYILRGQSGECLIRDSKLHGKYACYWSYPLGPSVVLQLCFSVPRCWLPREEELLAVAAAHCRQALERAGMLREIRRLQTASRKIEQEERHRIARDLHDDVGQALACLRLELEMLQREVPPGLRTRLGEACALAGRTATELRRAVASLSPSVLERMGLAAALRHFVARFRRVHRIPLTLRLPAGPLRLDKAFEAALYHIAEECLQNVAQHSGARHVIVCLRRADKTVRLTVSDNGAGFHAEKALHQPNSFGLTGIRDRAALLRGTLTIRSAPGSGTKVTVEFPLGPPSVVSHGKNSHSDN